MPTYVTLYNWTEKGMENIKDSPSRLDAAVQLAESMGCKVNAVYMVQGQYDLVLISEAPDDETGAKLALAIASKGFVKSETLRAYTEGEYRKIISEMP